MPFRARGVVRILVAAAVLVASGCGGGASGPPPTPTPTAVPDDGSRLVDAAVASGRLVGAAVFSDALASEPAYRDTFAAHFNYLTAEWEMKWDPIQRGGPGTYDYAGADALLAFAESHGTKVKGHALVWHGAMPAWTEGVDDAALGPLVEEYIRTVAARFRGQVIAWDVVNEAIADDGSGLRDSKIRRAMGPDYVARCFQLARSADPEALLIYNDYGTEGLGRKSDQVYELVRDLVQRGVPIDGVGLQMHISAGGYPSRADLVANIQRLAELGLYVNISEMDVRVRDVPGTPAAKLERQREVYHDVVSACMAVAQCHAVTLWGFTDKHSWVDSFFGLDDPLPFDELYRKKPAYYGMRAALLGQ
jgi:GH35 family endo-1,4-beta-xylanase